MEDNAPAVMEQCNIVQASINQLLRRNIINEEVVNGWSNKSARIKKIG